ncbi:hypothetical protein [Sphingomonas sp. GC_Shp_3]|uniref:hypothetical protein n=1 Tax=Sphingomonas sp. GC_Shp_3 TaxID=2937383 RepID=UPI00226A82E9|nr:hypothetical protein [Sphingomonas sp. GC_Shp_3]
MEIGIDVQGVAGNAFEQVDAFIGGNDVGDAVRQMVDRRSRRVLIYHSMNVPVDAEQQVRSHIIVQEQQRMGG